MRGPWGPVWGQAGWKGLVATSTSSSSKQRHGKAKEPQSKPVCSAQGSRWWGNRRGQRGWGGRPSRCWDPGPRATPAAHQPTPSISLALFSHSPTSRPPVNSSWLSTLTWAPPGSGEAFSGPEMIDGSVSHPPMDLGLIIPFSTHGQALEASGGDSPKPWSGPTAPGEEPRVRARLSHAGGTRRQGSLTGCSISLIRQRLRRRLHCGHRHPWRGLKPSLSLVRRLPG